MTAAANFKHWDLADELADVLRIARLKVPPKVSPTRL
jgi:hypothetical protein